MMDPLVLWNFVVIVHLRLKSFILGALTSVTNFASSMSRNMDRLSLDSAHRQRQEESRRHKPRGVSDGLMQGLAGFGISVLGK